MTYESSHDAGHSSPSVDHPRGGYHLEDGHLAEQGTRQKLIADSNTRYRALIEAQPVHDRWTTLGQKSECSQVPAEMALRDVNDLIMPSVTRQSNVSTHTGTSARSPK